MVILFCNARLESKVGRTDTKHLVGKARHMVADHLQEIIDAWNKHFPG